MLGHSWSGMNPDPGVAASSSPVSGPTPSIAPGAWTPPTPPPSSARPTLTQQIASWLAHQLDLPDGGSPARLLGLTVIDREAVAAGKPGGLRFIAVAEGDPYELLAGPAVLVRDRFDALALVATGRAWPPDGEPVVVISVMSLDHEPAFFVLGGPRLPAGINDEEPVGGIPLAVRRWRSSPAPIRPAA